MGILSEEKTTSFWDDDKKEVFDDKLELQKELKEEREAELAKQIASNKIDPNNIEEVNKFLHETAIKQDFLQKDPLFFEKLEWLTPKIEEAIETGELIDKFAIYDSFFQKRENDLKATFGDDLDIKELKYNINRYFYEEKYTFAADITKGLSENSREDSVKQKIIKEIEEEVNRTAPYKIHDFNSIPRDELNQLLDFFVSLNYDLRHHQNIRRSSQHPVTYETYKEAIYGYSEGRSLSDSVEYALLGGSYSKTHTDPLSHFGYSSRYEVIPANYEFFFTAIPKAMATEGYSLETINEVMNCKSAAMNIDLLGYDINMASYRDDSMFRTGRTAEELQEAYEEKAKELKSLDEKKSNINPEELEITLKKLPYEDIMQIIIDDSDLEETLKEHKNEIDSDYAIDIFTSITPLLEKHRSLFEPGLDGELWGHIETRELNNYPDNAPFPFTDTLVSPESFTYVYKMFSYSLEILNEHENDLTTALPEGFEEGFKHFSESKKLSKEQKEFIKELKEHLEDYKIFQ